MPGFVKVADLDDLPEGACGTVTVEGKDVALFNVDGEVFAMDDSCVHMGASLGSGRFQGKTVTCRAHGLRFNVTTGKIVGNDTIGVQAYPVKIEDGAIFVAAN
jgi:3-phenylpropionate/trans-cinnamate dioxygenase ferredoxin subunit